MIETYLSIAGSAASLYGLASGVKSGKQLEETLTRLDTLHTKVESISENIMLLDSLVVQDATRTKQEIIRDKKELKERLTPIQQVTGSKILSSGVILTPEKMREAMNKSPREVLLDIRPISSVISHSNPDMVPILFEDNEVSYIGWQLRGTIPLLFDCKYVPELWIPSKSKVQTVHSTKNAGAWNKIVNIVKELELIEEKKKIALQRDKINSTTLLYNKVPCKRCSTLILPATARATNGYCRNPKCVIARGLWWQFWK